MEILTKLGEQFGLKLSLDEFNVASVEIDEKFTVEFEYVESSDELFISGNVCKVTEHNKLKLFQRVLEENLYSKGTGLAQFGLDSDSEEMLLFFSVKVANTAWEGFAEQMLEFLTNASYWVDELRFIQDSDTEQLPQTGEQDLMSGFVRV